MSKSYVIPEIITLSLLGNPVFGFIPKVSMSSI